jgi:hypothetical protein
MAVKTRVAPPAFATSDLSSFGSTLEALGDAEELAPYAIREGLYLTAPQLKSLIRECDLCLF